MFQMTFIKVVECWVFSRVVAANIIAQSRLHEVEIFISGG